MWSFRSASRGAWLLAIGLGATPALSATLQEVQGPVLVSSGGGFQRVGSGTPVGVGTRVMVRPGGSAVVVHSNGCREVVGPGEVVSVGSLCQTNQASDSSSLATFAVGAAAIGGGIALFASQTDNNNGRPASP
jgi:hypothetical protein